MSVYTPPPPPPPHTHTHTHTIIVLYKVILTLSFSAPLLGQVSKQLVSLVPAASHICIMCLDMCVCTCLTPHVMLHTHLCFSSLADSSCYRDILTVNVSSLKHTQPPDTHTHLLFPVYLIFPLILSSPLHLS